MTIHDLILALETARAANAAAMHACTLTINALNRQLEEEGASPAAAPTPDGKEPECSCPLTARRPNPVMGHPKRTYCTICTKEHNA